MRKKVLLFLLFATLSFPFVGISSSSAATCVEYNDDATCAEYHTRTMQRCTMRGRPGGVSRCSGSFNTEVGESCADIYGMTPAGCSWSASTVEVQTSSCKRYNDDATCKSYAVNGGWSSRSRGSRGSCNSSTGKQTRSGSRTCTNPTPSGGGAYCSGSSTTTQTINCRVNGGWSSRSTGSWSVCNSSTGTQSRTDTRTCTNPSPKNGGSSCSGSSTRVVTQNCRVNGGWSSRSTGSWSVCNSSTGTQSRTDTRTCTNPSPKNGGSSCSGSSSRVVSQNCVVNGGWSSRSTGSWSVCNSSTGTQSRTDTRTCTNPSPKNGGSSCTGNSTRVVSQNCRVNGGWSSRSYSSRGSCNTSTGTKNRTGTRYCNNPTPKNGGSYCSGSSTYTDTTTCPVTANCGTSNNSCSIGNYSDTVDSGGYSRWQCIGLNGGSNDTCAYRTDYTAPSGSVSYSPSGWTNGSVTVTVSCSDSGGAGCSQSTYTKTVSSNGSGYITISDNLGNSRNIYYNVTNIDKINPTGNVSHNTNWYNSTQTVNFGASDTGGSNIRRMWLQRSLNGGGYNYISGADYNNLNTSSISRSYNQPAGNNQRYRYRLIVWDNAGNISYNYGPSSELKFDTIAPSNPTINSSTHTAGVWINNNDPAFSISANGQGPSPATNYYCFDVNNTCNPNITGNSNSYTNIADGSHYFRAKTCDTGGCSGISSFEIKIDTVAPNAGDIGVVANYPKDGDDLHANNREFSYFVENNNYSPIVRIEGYLEDANNPDTYSAMESVNGNTLTFLGDITQVDNDADPSDGKRMYTFVITKISDSAGNSISTTTATPVKTFRYYVYANPDSNLITAVDVNQLDKGNVANGQQQDLVLNVKDAFGNRLIPKGDIGRKITFVFNGSNTLKLNQYNPSTSDSSIFLELPKVGSVYDNNIFDTGNNTYGDLESTTGKYTFKYKVYTPSFNATQTNGQQLVNGDARIDSIKILIEQNAGVNLNPKTSFQADIDIATGIDFEYRPMIKTKFTGDFVRNYSINQDLENQIQITTDGFRAINNGKLYLGFGYPQTDVNAAHDNLDMYVNGNKIAEGHNNAYELGNILTKNFQSEIKQTRGGLTDEEKNHYISTHISYSIDGYNVSYDGDIVGKTNYSYGTAIDSSTNLGVKILGLTQSKNQIDLSSNQSGTDIFQLGNNTKADLREQIHKNVAEITRSVNPKNISNLENLSGDTWSDGIDAPKLLNKNVLFTQGFVTINPSGNISGNKTLLVKGGDVYITKNIISQNKTNDILGIIVMQDEDGNGGNIYIDPSVSRIDAVMYSDKSILNYDGTQVITDGTNLENQIYFFGSLFTENTLGGYISGICPYFVEDCRYEVAQQYDLNFLRGYYTFDDDNDGLEDESNGISYFTYPDSNFKYPVVIEYNPNIQNNPPALFDINQ